MRCGAKTHAKPLFPKGMEHDEFDGKWVLFDVLDDTGTFLDGGTASGGWCHCISAHETVRVFGRI